MYLDNIFSEENIMAYSEACVELAVDVPEYKNSWKHRDFNTLVIPSRGAVPLFLGMVYAMDKLRSFGGDQDHFYRNLGIQNIMSPLLPEDIKISNETNGKPIRVLLIPFTADLNISRFDPKLNDEEFVPKIRKYWANVTRSFFKEPSERVKDPYFISFADFVLRDVEGRDDLARFYEEFHPITSFSLIDTAISGRAAVHILSSLEELALKNQNPLLIPNTFLVVDDRGSKLKPKYSKYLNRKKLEGLLNTYPIPRIVSEDEGASLLGVAAVIYPSIMRASKQFYLNGEEFFIGAGAWHSSSDIPGNYFENFKTFMNTIYKGIDFIYKRNYLAEDSTKEQTAFMQSREAFLERAKEVRLLAQTSEDISTLNPTKKYSFGECYETSSHVLHAPFTEESERRFAIDLCSKKIPGLQHIF